jgi:hypothetical protein
MRTVGYTDVNFGKTTSLLNVTERLRRLLANSNGRSARQSTRIMGNTWVAHRAVNNYVYDRARSFLRRRHNVGDPDVGLALVLRPFFAVNYLGGSAASIESSHRSGQDTAYPVGGLRGFVQGYLPPAVSRTLSAIEHPPIPISLQPKMERAIQRKPEDASALQSLRTCGINA